MNKDTFWFLIPNIPLCGVICSPNLWCNKIGIEEWCEEHNIKVEGSTLTFPDEETILLFTMKWS